MSQEQEFKDVYELLSYIQTSLSAPKGRKNKHGGFRYRSMEDINNAVKPLLPTGAIFVVNDEIFHLEGRHYVKATAQLIYKKDYLQSTAYAREAYTQKGMNEAQLSGSTSSYARKYAANGLFAIDDHERTPAPEMDSTESPNIDNQVIAKTIELQELADLMQDGDMKDRAIAALSNLDNKLTMSRLEKIEKAIRKELQNG